MSYQSNNLNLEILEESDPADLTTVSDNFDKIDAAIGDIATFETSPTTAAHSVGEYLLYEGRLYKVTTAISAGANLTLGTNVSAANIGDDIKTLQDSVSSFVSDKATSDGVLGTNGTVQIPPSIMRHSFILIGMRRYSRGDYIVIPKQEITDGAYTDTTGGVVLNEAQHAQWRIMISSSGLITRLDNSTTQPFVMIWGFL